MTKRRVGRHQGASAISDRSGFRFPMSEMVVEPGTNWLVHRSETDGGYSIVEHPLNNVGDYLRGKTDDPRPVENARLETFKSEPIKWSASGRGGLTSNTLTVKTSFKKPAQSSASITFTGTAQGNNSVSGSASASASITFTGTAQAVDPAFDLEQASFDASAGIGAAYDIFIGDSGGYLFRITTGNTIARNTLNTPYDITSFTGTGSQSQALSAQTFGARGLFFKPDGSKVYIVDAQNDNILQYSLSTPWDLSTLSYDSVSVSVSHPLGTTPASVFFGDSGERMYVVIGFGSTLRVLQYSLSTAWDVSTASYDSKLFNVAGGDGRGIWFNDDGTKMFLLDENSDDILQYSLSTPWDVTTATSDGVDLDISSQTTTASGLWFKEDGLQMVISSTTTGNSYSYTFNV